MPNEPTVSLTPEGLEVVKGIIARALEMTCLKCGVRAGQECDEPGGVHIERVRASRPLNIDCPECGAVRGIACFNPGGEMCPDRVEEMRRRDGRKGT